MTQDVTAVAIVTIREPRGPFPGSAWQGCDALDDNRAAIARAIRDGKKPPAPISQEVTDEQTRQGELRVRAAKNRAVAAARAYEASIPANHEGLRPIIAARVPALAATSAARFREAQQAYREGEGLAQLLFSLDSLRSRRSDTIPEQARAFDAHRKAVQQAHLENRPGLGVRLPLAWRDVEAIATGIPGELIARDPFNSEAAK
ncbi:hypothetical protein GA0074692_5008 [Micromonospora pallida]|uniref:Uncharacterized protein n=1 Tax=Micromonospora pallida TaxID=145854 RepID=A0A1C6T9S8_9ACTN|nr:hypothetical protein [Micromonospora pallida]SCL38429.1 hypothetical protein GA0074692_5008 [Micromonospora pallida]